MELKMFRRERQAYNKLGFALPVGAVLLLLFFFADFLCELAFSVTTKLGACLVDAVFGVRFRVQKIPENKSLPLEGLRSEQEK